MPARNLDSGAPAAEPRIGSLSVRRLSPWQKGDFDGLLSGRQPAVLERIEVVQGDAHARDPGPVRLHGQWVGFEPADAAAFEPDPEADLLGAGLHARGHSRLVDGKA